MEPQTLTVRGRFVNAVRKFVRDERGDALQNVLLLAIAAVGIFVGFKYLWGSDNTGLIAITIKEINNKFQSSIMSFFGG